MHADNENETEEQSLETKEQSRKNAAERLANEEPPIKKPSIEDFTKSDRNTTSFPKNGIKANARIQVKQGVDLVLNNFKL